MKLKTYSTLIILLMASNQVLADVAVIAHPSNANALDKSAVSRLFLGKSKTFPDGTQAIPLNQSESSAATEQFNSKALSKSASQLKAYWSKLVFTGKGTPPKVVDNDAAVLELVASNPNSIGYVDSGAVTAGVKVLATF